MITRLTRTTRKMKESQGIRKNTQAADEFTGKLRDAERFDDMGIRGRRQVGVAVDEEGKR